MNSKLRRFILSQRYPTNKADGAPKKKNKAAIQPPRYLPDNQKQVNIIKELPTASVFELESHNGGLLFW